MTYQPVPIRLSVVLLFVIEFLLAATASAQELPKTEIVPNIPHSGEVNSVTFSPDGRHVLTGGGDKTVRLWDGGTGQLLRSFEGHTDRVKSVAFSPDGTRLLSASNDSTLRLWDAATGQTLLTFNGHSGRVTSVAFSRDGTHVVSGGWDRTIKLWSASTGQLLRTLSGHTENIYSVAFSPDGSSVLSGSGDRTLELWDVATGRLLRTFVGHTASAMSVAFSPDGKRVLSGGEDNTLRLWDSATGQLLRTFTEHPDWVLAVAFSPDGTRVLSGSRDTAKLWDTATGQLVRTFEGHASTIYAAAFSPDGAKVLLGSYEEAQLWDVGSGQLLRKLGASAGNVFSIAFSADGTLLVSGNFDKTLKLWDLRSGQLLRTFQGHDGAVYCVAFSADGTRVLSGGWDKTVRLWDTGTGRLLRTFTGHSDWVNSVALSPDGARVLSGSSDRSMKLWDAETGRVLRTFAGFTGAVHSVAFSPDGTRVLAGGESLQLWDTTTLWDRATGMPARTFVGSRGTVWSVAFSPDGTRVLAGADDGTMKLWDAATGHLLRTFEGHTGTVWSVAVSLDGTRVLSGAQDHTIKIWDFATGRLLRMFKGESGATVAFSPNAAIAASSGGDATVRLWNVATGEMAAMLLGSVNGEWLALTPQGFFSASPKGEQMVTVVRGVEATAIGQIHQSLFSPDLLREALAGDPEVEVKRAAEVINLEKVVDSGPAPLVAINSGKLDRYVSSDIVSIPIRIKDRGKGIGRIEWRVNGVTTTVTSAKPRADPEYEVTQTLALDPGDNNIEVVAYNASNLLASLPAKTTIKFTGPADQAKPKLHILAIGINAYVDKGWAPPGKGPVSYSPLVLAVKDATTFGADMKRAAESLYEEVRVTHALDTGATRVNLEAAIGKLAGEVHPRDTFILFVAAHGASENGRFYIIPQDFQGGPDALARSAISQGRLQEWLANRIKAKKALILLDTCESGALVAGHTRSRLDASETGVGRLHEATGRPVLTAAAIGQFAHEGLIAQSGDRHGVFTWALLDALRNADTNGNGQIELSEVVAHVQSVVPKIAAKFGGAGRAAIAASDRVFGKQSARFGSRGEDFVLARRLQR